MRTTHILRNARSKKEEAIAWPAARRAARMASNLADRPGDEPLAEALVAAVTGLYGTGRADGLPAGWLRGFRELVAQEPSLHGEYLKASDAAERALGNAIAARVGATGESLSTLVIAAMVVGAERAAVRHWITTRDGPLVETVRTAVREATAGVGRAG